MRCCLENSACSFSLSSLCCVDGCKAPMPFWQWKRGFLVHVCLFASFLPRPGARWPSFCPCPPSICSAEEFCCLTAFAGFNHLPLAILISSAGKPVAELAQSSLDGNKQESLRCSRRGNNKCFQPASCIVYAGNIFKMIFISLPHKWYFFLSSLHCFRLDALLRPSFTDSSAPC